MYEKIKFCPVSFGINSVVLPASVPGGILANWINFAKLCSDLIIFFECID